MIILDTSSRSDLLRSTWTRCAMCINPTHNTILTRIQSYALKIKSICDEFLRQVEVPFKIPEVDPAFYADCCRAARDWGIPLDGTINILPYLRVGTDMAEIAYGHMSHETQIYMALYTAAAAGCDEACASDVELLKTFGHRFMRQKHGNPLLDSYDLLLRTL